MENNTEQTEADLKHNVIEDLLKEIDNSKNMNNYKETINQLSKFTRNYLNIDNNKKISSFIFVYNGIFIPVVIICSFKKNYDDIKWDAVYGARMLFYRMLFCREKLKPLLTIYQRTLYKVFCKLSYY